MRKTTLAVGLTWVLGACCDVADPGALIEVTTKSEVGVLLDELPASERDRAAAALLAKPAAFWEQRARMQIEAMLYRLVYRDDYYDEADGKRQMPLPPREKWRIEVQAARRTTIDGHDVVAVRYAFASVLLTSVNEAGQADPALAAAGGAAQETFTLPVDPDLLLERTGMACMNEAEFPPNSVDSENARAFFDDTCTADSVGPGACHLAAGVQEDCTEALEHRVGRTLAVARFERVQWDAARADAARVGRQRNGGAQLAALVEGLGDARLVYRYIPAGSCTLVERCVGAPGWRRLLQFSASVANLGDAAATFGDTALAEQHHIIELSACHGHFHFSHYGDFTFGAGGALSSKRAFCLESTSRYLNTEATPLTHGYSCEAQGIAPGWGDDYIAGLDCQWIDVTSASRDQVVTAPLKFHVNPDGFLCEGMPQTNNAGEVLFEPTSFTTEAGEPVDRIACDESEGWELDNVATRAFTVPIEGSFVTEPCARGQLGPRKNCGFVEQVDGATCMPGAPVSVTCSASAGAKHQAVRFCPRSKVLGTGLACTFLDSYATAVVGSEPTSVQFTCPCRLDADEPGGEYAIYVAPLVEGDPIATVTCR